MALLTRNVLFTLLVYCVSVKAQSPLNFTQLSEKNGYKSEEHTVVTDDGYILSLFRITKGLKCKEENKRTPIFFMPPLLSGADTALEAGSDAAVPFLISDACFDTWVGNPRGTYYGRKHIRLNPDNDEEFWKFSVDEIGKYDVPVMIEYVLKYTGVDKLIYIGFSQGGGSFFVMCSERPDICEKIKLMIGLAPASRHLHTKSRLFRELVTNVENNVDVFNDMKIWELLGRDQVTLTINRFCQNTPLCEWLVSMIDTPHPSSVTREVYKNMLLRFPAGTSVQNIVRYGQSTRTEKFVKFNYGKEKNEIIYGQPTPPEYNLTAANLPILIITGRNDGIVDLKDVKWLASQLPNVKELVIVKDPLWNHVDMFYSKFIRIMIFPKILKYLMQYNDM